MNKCWGELLFITIYVVILCLLFVSIVYQVMYGKIYTLLVEWAICLVLD